MNGTLHFLCLHQRFYRPTRECAPIKETLCGIRESALFAAQSMFQKSAHLDKCYSCHTDTFFIFSNMELLHTKPISALCQWTVTNLRRRKSSARAFMLRGVSGNAKNFFTMHRKIHRKNDHTNMDPSLSGKGALISKADRKENNFGLSCLG